MMFFKRQIFALLSQTVRLPGRMAYEFFFHQYRVLFKVPNFEGKNWTFFDTEQKFLAKPHLLYHIEAYHKESLMISFLTTLSLFITSLLLSVYSTTKLMVFYNMTPIYGILYWFALSLFLAIVPSSFDIPLLKTKSQLVMKSSLLKKLYSCYMTIMGIITKLHYLGADILLGMLFTVMLSSFTFKLIGLNAWTTL